MAFKEYRRLSILNAQRTFVAAVEIPLQSPQLIDIPQVIQVPVQIENADDNEQTAEKKQTASNKPRVLISLIDGNNGRLITVNVQVSDASFTLETNQVCTVLGLSGKGAVFLFYKDGNEDLRFWTADESLVPKSLSSLIKSISLLINLSKYRFLIKFIEF